MIYKTEPRPYQRTALEKAYPAIKECKGFAFLCSPGTGKSKMLLDVAANLYLEGEINFLFLIAPNGIDEQWLNEQIPLHCACPYLAYLWEGISTQKAKRNLDSFLKNKDAKLKIFCINTESFQYETYLILTRNILKKFDVLLALDEASQIKNLEANRTHNLCYKINELVVDKRPGRTNGNIVDVSPNSKYRAILTGSIVTESPFNIFAPLTFLKFNFFGMDFRNFRATFGIERRQSSFKTSKDFYATLKPTEFESIRKRVAKGDTIELVARDYNMGESDVKYIVEHPSLKVPYKNLDILKKALDPISVTINLEDVSDVPEPITVKRFIEMGKEQKKIYNQLRYDLMSEYEGVSLTINHILSICIRLTQVTSGYFPATIDENGWEMEDTKLIPIKDSAKQKVLLEDLEEFDFARPLLISCIFTQDILSVSEILKRNFPNLRVAEYYGEIAKSDREAIRQKFSDGYIDVLILNPKKGGIGLNLQRANKTISYSRSASYDTWKQLVGRTYREGQTEAALLRPYICKNSFDERVDYLIGMKTELDNYFSGKTIKEFFE